MNSLRPSSVSDTTPLQRLESQSSSSEPSSPTLNGSTPSSTDNCSISNGSSTVVTLTPPSSKTLSLSNHNNNKIEIRLNHYVSSQSSPDDKKKMSGTVRTCGRVFLELAILGCVGLPLLGFHFWGETSKRGFMCNDISLKYPYRESTIHGWMLYLMGFVVPASIIITVEFFVANRNRMQGFGNLNANRYYLCHLALPDWIVECYKKIGLLFFGAGIGQLAVDIAKYSIGRLRPHFFAVCQPILYDGTTCDDLINEGRYIEDFTCRGGEGITARMLKEVRLSFPSGHANFSCFSMIYLAIYLQKRMDWQRSKMLKHLLQFLFIMFAWYTALTRVSDYKHHWSDVLAGAAIGTLNAVVMSSSFW